MFLIEEFEKDPTSTSSPFFAFAFAICLSDFFLALANSFSILSASFFASAWPSKCPNLQYMHVCATFDTLMDDGLEPIFHGKNLSAVDVILETAEMLNHVQSMCASPIYSTFRNAKFVEVPSWPCFCPNLKYGFHDRGMTRVQKPCVHDR